MGVVWGSPSRSQRPFSGVARKVAGFRRLATLGLAALSSVGRRQVELSDHAQALASLRGLHVSRVLPVGGTRKFGVSSLDAPLLAVTQRRHPVDRSEVEA